MPEPGQGTSPSCRFSLLPQPGELRRAAGAHPRRPSLVAAGSPPRQPREHRLCPACSRHRQRPSIPPHAGGPQEGGRRSAKVTPRGSAPLADVRSTDKVQPPNKPLQGATRDRLVGSERPSPCQRASPRSAQPPMPAVKSPAVHTPPFPFPPEAFHTPRLLPRYGTATSSFAPCSLTAPAREAAAATAPGWSEMGSRRPPRWVAPCHGGCHHGEHLLRGTWWLCRAPTPQGWHG